MKRRVAVTSFGIVSPLGASKEEVCDTLEKGCASPEPAGHAGMGQIPVFPVKEFDVKTYTGRFKNARYLTRGGALAMAAAITCVKGAPFLTGEKLDNAGLFMGAGPHLDLGLECPTIIDGKMDTKAMKALWILPFLPNTAASLISSFLGVHGDNLTVGTACAASLQAVGEAFRKVRDGYLDAALAGGGDSRLGFGALAAYTGAGALHRDGDVPYIPFGKNRRGFVPGEGGGFVLLEALDKAGGQPLCEILGYGASMDGGQPTAPRPDGFYAERAVRNALADAGVAAKDVGLVLAHGTGTQLNDDMETGLIRRVFPDARVTALKSQMGHGASASGILELCAFLCCMGGSGVPPVRYLNNPIDKNIHFVTEGFTPFPDIFVIQNFGFGGQNAALVLKRRI